MSFKIFDQDLTATLTLNFTFNLTRLGISASDLYNGIVYDNYRNSVSINTRTSAGTLSDGTNQTSLLLAYPFSIHGRTYSLCVYERYFRGRTSSNHWGEAHASINKLDLPTDFVDDIVADQTGSYSATLEEFTLGSFPYFSTFSGWKYINRMYYNLDNVMYQQIYKYLFIGGARTGIDITASGTVTYTGSNKYLTFNLSAVSEIKTYSAGTWHNYDTNPPFTA